MSRKTIRRSVRLHPHSGTILICVLVCMGIATAIVLTAVKSSLRARRQMQVERQLEQTRWLLDTAIAHATRQFQNDANYEGEQWIVSPPLYDGWISKVNIAVERKTEQVETEQTELDNKQTVKINVVAEIQAGESNASLTHRSQSFYLDQEISR